jgi:hypothetical protein
VFWESCAYNTELAADFFTRASLEQRFSKEHGKAKNKK